VDDNNWNPQWNESFHIYCAHYGPDVVFWVKIWAPINAFLIGRTCLSVQDVIGGQEVDRWLDILDEEKKPIPGVPKIHVRVRFTDVTRDRLNGWGEGVGDGQYPGVPFTFFKQRFRCRVVWPRPL
jgi:phospholipase D1/2